MPILTPLPEPPEAASATNIAVLELTVAGVTALMGSDPAPSAYSITANQLGTLIPYTSGRVLAGSVTMDFATPAVFPDGSQVTIGTSTISSMIIPEDGLYRLRLRGIDFEDDTIDSSSSGRGTPLYALVITESGQPAAIRRMIGSSFALNQSAEEFFEQLNAGDRVQIAMFPSAFDAADQYDVVIRADPDDAQVPTTTDLMIVSSLSLQGPL
ncbi:MAG: hypothetical protein AAFP15_12230 [Bacteroidota bacterium]